MNPFTKYLARFLARLSVPHCEDCRNLVDGNECQVLSGTTHIQTNTSWKLPADRCRANEYLCGKHGRYFEPKEKS